MCVKYSISLSGFTYKLRLSGEGGVVSQRVAYKLNYVFKIQIRPFAKKPHGFLPGTGGFAAE